MGFRILIGLPIRPVRVARDTSNSRAGPGTPNSSRQKRVSPFSRRLRPRLPGSVLSNGGQRPLSLPAPPPPLDPVHLSRRCPVAEASTCTPARNRGSSRQLLQPLHPCAVTLLKLKMSSSSSDGKLPIPLLLPSCKAAIPLPACSLVLLCSVHSCCSGSSAALLVCFLHLLEMDTSSWMMIYLINN